MENWMQRPGLRLAVAYFAAASTLGLFAGAIGGVASGLWWPAAALAFVAYLYAGPGASGFRKKDGRHPLAIQLLLAPYLIGARLLPRWRTRHYPAPNPISDGVWLGRLPLSREMARSQFAALVDMTAELSIGRGNWQYVSLPCLDAVPPSPAQLATAAREIERLRISSGPVLVACALGHTRSACAVAAWLLATGRAADVADAISQIQLARPQVVFRKAHKRALGTLVESTKG